MNGMFEARDPAMQNYLALAEEMANKFERFSITQVPRCLNKKADALRKIASSVFSHFAKDVWVEVLSQKSTDMAATVEEVETWMSPIVTYLKNGTLPIDGAMARKIRMKAPMYTLRDGVLFKKSFTAPLLRCVSPSEAETIVREVHEGTYGMHAGFRTVVGKIMRLGYFWPSMYRDTKEIIKACASCQRHAPQIHMPVHELIPVTSAWTFYKWAIDLEIMCRFGIPHEIVSDNGKQFAHDPFRSWCDGLNIKQTFSSVAHLQANGLKENLDLLEERRDAAAIREASNKQKISKYYNQRVKERTFRLGDFVWRNNNASRVKNTGKLA
ncbi:uncharacterized protein [Rutidosis leptorrhynchoides]|uniref:uncharacterized protein n=1 Tax=Rutidosis leptorrhynchoides TaxID=125765 RepID=UPI003A99A74B